MALAALAGLHRQGAQSDHAIFRVVLPDNRHDHATPVSAILLVIATGMLFSFIDTSAKYLVLSGIAAPFVSWVRFAIHA